jgi:hypothetical protein
MLWFSILLAGLVALLPTAIANPLPADVSAAQAVLNNPNPTATFPFKGISALGGNSPLSKLNSQVQRPCQVFLPSGFYLGKANTLTVRGPIGQKITVFYQTSPVALPTLKAGDNPIQQQSVVLTAEKPVATLTIALPAPPADGSAKVSEWPNSLQLQVVAEEVTTQVEARVQLLSAAGTATAETSYPLLLPHSPTGSPILPTLEGLDANAVRSIQTVADFAHNPEKRKRLQYDGKVNSTRAIDRNPLIIPAGASGFRP